MARAGQQGTRTYDASHGAAAAELVLKTARVRRGGCLERMNAGAVGVEAGMQSLQLRNNDGGRRLAGWLRYGGEQHAEWRERRNVQLTSAGEPRASPVRLASSLASCASRSCLECGSLIASRSAMSTKRALRQKGA